MNNFRLKKELKSRKPLKIAEMFHPDTSEVKSFVSEVPKHFPVVFLKAPKKLIFFLFLLF